MTPASLALIGGTIIHSSFVSGAVGGASLAPWVLERMTDHGFRRWTRAIIFAIAVVYLGRAGWLVWRG